MMFIFHVPIDEEEVRPHRKRKHIMTEKEYFTNDMDRLALLFCPNCGEHLLFRGGVYIGCFGCLSYFSEDEVIAGNRLEE